jgi:membrane-associated protease RseP (regulator of RpoE activity)
MSSSRRLWTGDWERDSALRAEELAERRRQRAEQPAPAPAPEPETVAAGDHRSLVASIAAAVVAVVEAVGAAVLAVLRLLRSAARRTVSLVRRANARVAAVAALVLALVVALAFGLSALFGGSSSPGSAPVSAAALNEAQRWLGVQLVPLARGGVAIETVSQNGTGAAAGLEPGDVLSQIDGHSIFTVSDAARAIDAMSPGDQAVIVINRGSEIYSTSFPMPPRSGP